MILLRHRDQTKLRTTVEGLIKEIGDDGRIHTTFNQTIAATGRLSSTEPNLQNIPIRTEAGRRIRDAFVVGQSRELSGGAGGEHAVEQRLQAFEVALQRGQVHLSVAGEGRGYGRDDLGRAGHG